MKRRSFFYIGVEKFWIELTFAGRGAIPLASVWCPRKSMLGAPKTHLSRLNFLTLERSVKVSGTLHVGAAYGNWCLYWMSSIYVYMYGRPRKTSLISQWNVWTAFRKTNGTFTNSYKSNGVVTTILRMSSGTTEIWWYGFISSILENMWVPCSPDTK